MTILTTLSTALAPHGFSVKRLAGDDICDDGIEIIGADGIATEIDVQIYSAGSGSGFGVNEWADDALTTHYSGPDAARAIAVVLERLKVSA